MSKYNPGEGWREVQFAPHDGEAEYLTHTPVNDDSAVTYWVREEPVSPLPTEPYTVIRAAWHKRLEDSVVLTLLEDGNWIGSDGEADAAYVVQHNITGFEVLAEPHGADCAAGYRAGVGQNDRTREERVRDETVKAVLNRVLKIPPIWRDQSFLTTVAHEFGVKL